MAIENPYYIEKKAAHIKAYGGYDKRNKNELMVIKKPEELTLMLYNGMIKFLNQGKLFMNQRDISNSHDSIVRAQNILYELNITLNMEYDISTYLRKLYDFMNDRLIDANIEKDSSIIDEVLELAIDMRDTWQEAMELAKNHKK